MGRLGTLTGRPGKVVDEPAAAPEGAGAGRTSKAIPAAPARADSGDLKYNIIEVKMTWRSGDERAKTGAQELSEKLTAAAKKGWRLEGLQFHNVPQGEGYNDLVTAYAIMVRGRGQWALIKRIKDLLAHRECPIHSPEARALQTMIEEAENA